MKINPITNNNQNFEGKIVVKNSISAQQRHLFNLHKPNLDKMIQDLPFDLFVEQSKSKRTISLSADVKDPVKYVVHKNEQNFEEAACGAINDGKQKSEAYKKMISANEMLYYLKYGMHYIVLGNYKEARDTHAKLAELAVKDFDTYKKVTNFKIVDIPMNLGLFMFYNTLKYKTYRLFTNKTPEEKQLIKMNKAYLRDMKAKGEVVMPQIIKFPGMYY